MPWIPMDTLDSFYGHSQSKEYFGNQSFSNDILGGKCSPILQHIYDPLRNVFVTFHILKRSTRSKGWFRGANTICFQYSSLSYDSRFYLYAKELLFSTLIILQLLLLFNKLALRILT
uniref:Uncharacterized protein n=1 Tax=Glossina austeni TaxID=7395 RepID=A0A1A9VUP2_GLOAU